MKTVDADEMRAIDQEAQERYGIPELLLMENAGREAAEALLEGFPGKEGKVAVFCGKGNNGGDGFATARHLLLREIPVVVFFIGKEENLNGSAKTHFEMLVRWRCLIRQTLTPTDLQKGVIQEGPFAMAVDALLGIGLKGEVREPYHGSIEIVNRLPCPVLSVDIPSGLCATTGRILGGCIQAERTVTFGLPKKGFFLKDGPSVTGELVVRNIGYPRELLVS